MQGSETVILIFIAKPRTWKQKIWIDKWTAGK